MIAGSVTFTARIAEAAAQASFLAAVPGAAVYGDEGYGDEGYSDTGGANAATFLATVSRAVLDSWEGAGVAYQARIVFGGVEIPVVDLVGAIELADTGDTPLNRASFTVRGAMYSVFETLKTWTKTPVDIYLRHGQLWRGDPQLWREDLVFRGNVLPATRQPCDVEPAPEISCGGRIVMFDQHDLCYELEPLSDLTRGAIVREALAGAGLVSVDCPPGAVYSKPVYTDQQRPVAWLRDFSEPEGWLWRMRPNASSSDSTLESYPDELKRLPLQPDHTWHYSQCSSIDVETPSQEPPSRYVIRGTSALHVDEIGITTEVTRTEIESIYALKVAVQEQQTDGSVTASGFTPESEFLRMVTIIEDAISRRGDKVVSQVTTEWGWYNPPAGYLKTNSGAGPGGPNGDYGFLQVLIDSDGNYVKWSRERFVAVGQRDRAVGYDGNGTMTAETTTESRWYAKEAGVRQTAATPGTGGWHVGTVVGGDSRSYSPEGVNQIYSYGVSERREKTFTYDAATGAALVEKERRSAWYARKGAVDVLGYYERFDGSAQVGSVAQFQLVGVTTKVNILGTDGHMRGAVEQSTSFHAPRVAIESASAHYWGEFYSYAVAENLQVTGTKNTTFNQLGENQYEEVIQDATGTRSQVYSGRTPMARFQASAWTRLVQEPLELIVDDPIAEALWGFRREVISSDYLQTLEEAERMLERRRFHDRARTITVQRPVTAAREGDTVLLIDPRQGIHHRCLLKSSTRRFDLAHGLATGTYVLEADL